MTRSGDRRTPVALVAGGLAWTLWSVATAVTGTASGTATVVTALSGLALGVALVGLAFTHAWTYRSPGGEGAGVAALGALLFAAGQASLVVRGPGGLSTWLLAPGVLALVGGSVLLGVGIVRARRVPPWLGVALVVGSVLFLGFERAAMLAIPFGLAWVALGGYLWRAPERPTERPESSALAR